VPSAEALAAVGPFAQFCSRPAADVAADLERFRELLTKWQPAQNLVSRETLASFWTRHVADSLQLLPLIRPSDQHFVDLGSGGGLPGIPLALALQRSHVLVESNSRKASFLRAVIRELALPATVDSERIEDFVSRETPDVITARALAPLPALLGLAAPLSGPTTRAIFHKGREYREELQQAAARWTFDVLQYQSAIAPDSVLLEIANLRPKSSI
jgi:16S rRNA (guanine527-N7)-methyltransferase